MATRRTRRGCSATSHGLGSPIYSLEQSKLPKGRKDEKWLTKRDGAQQALRTLWEVARQGYQTTLMQNTVSQRYFDPQLEQMKQCESPEHFLQLESEKQQILARRYAVTVRVPPAPTISEQEPFLPLPNSTSSALKHYVQPPAKEKAKTRPEDPPAISTSPSTTAETTKDPAPTLYVLKPDSITHRLVNLLFPDPNDGPSKECLDWLDFVRALTELGFRAEHRAVPPSLSRGGSSCQRNPSRLSRGASIFTCRIPQPR